MTAAEILARDKAICDAATKGALKIRPFISFTSERVFVVLTTNDKWVAEFREELDAQEYIAARTGWPRAIEALEYFLRISSDYHYDAVEVERILSGGNDERR